MSDIQEMTKITCRAMDRENNLQTYKQRARLMARLKTIEKTSPTTPSQRKQYMAKMNRWQKQVAAIDVGNIRAREARKWGTLLQEGKGSRSDYEALVPVRPDVSMQALNRDVIQPDGTTATEVCTTQEDIMDTQVLNWKKLFSLANTGVEPSNLVDKALDGIRTDKSVSLSPAMLASLAPAKMFAATEITKAINGMTESAAGTDGLSCKFFQDHIDTLSPVLEKLFKEIYNKKYMTSEMRQAKVTLAFKGGALDPLTWKSYRPIAVTTMTYRILGRCVQQTLANGILTHIIGPSQRGFIPGALLEEDVLAVTEYAHFANVPGREGLILLLDNAKAYDRVRFPFLEKVLEAFGFPAEFRDLIGTMHRDLSTTLKINGWTGPAFPHLNGVRQGCCLAPSLYVLCHEVFLRMLRLDSELLGALIPDKDGRLDDTHFATLLERAFADDTAIALKNDSQLQRLGYILQEYCKASGALINLDKCVGIRLGQCRNVPGPTDSIISSDQWFRLGIDSLPTKSKYLGIRLGSPTDIEANWENLISKIETQCTHALNQARPSTLQGRLNWARGVFAAKCWHTFRLQYPPKEIRDKFITRLQKLVDTSTLSWYFVNREVAA